MRYFCVVSYFGKNYQGWQRQDNFNSVEKTIENALEKLFGEKIIIFASGRTDAGVHAIGQTFHFDGNKIYKINDLKYKLNCILPDDIEIKAVKKVKEDFHARYSAKEKIYYYLIKNKSKDVFGKDYCYLTPYKIDFALLKEAAKMFEGEHDFKDFTSKDIDERNFIRNIFKVSVSKYNGNIKITFSGNGFMKYQIRFMVGCIVQVACKRESLEFIKEHLNSSKREIIRYKAPSEGLYLLKVKY